MQKRFSDFDGLGLYANIDRIEDDQAQAVLDFVCWWQRIRSFALRNLLLAKQSRHRRIDGRAVSAARRSGIHDRNRRA